MTNRTDTILDAPDGWYWVSNRPKPHYYKRGGEDYFTLCGTANSRSYFSERNRWSDGQSNNCISCARKLAKLEATS